MRLWGGLRFNLETSLALEVLGKCLNQQGVPKNVMLGTKNIKIGPLGPELAHTQSQREKEGKITSFLDSL